MTEPFEKKHHQYAGWSQELFSELVTVKGPGKLLYLSGIGAEEGGSQPGAIRHPGNVYEQTRTAYRKAAELLARHGACLKDVVKITTYLLDTRECPNYHRARREAFEGIADLPAHTLIIVHGLAWPGMLVEVDLTAAIPAP
ncbi:MAG TPA: RidA family protein [Chthoniobacteraceae bacterium]|nr:RidA family protein [Chthoniobacteraceae bacterium]